jgi:hypothetical protein
MVRKKNSLVLFVKGFPATMRANDIRSLLTDVCARDTENRGCGAGCVRSCEIVRILDPSTHQAEHYVLAEISPARCALACVKALDGKYFAGSKIVTRRYRQRSVLAEHRYDAKSSVNRADRRRRDRRRDGLRVEIVDSVDSVILSMLMRLLQPQPNFQLDSGALECSTE